MRRVGSARDAAGGALARALRAAAAVLRVRRGAALGPIRQEGAVFADGCARVYRSKLINVRRCYRQEFL